VRKRRNRKTVIKDGWIVHNGERIEICNSDSYGVYKKTVLAFIEQLDAAIQFTKEFWLLTCFFQ